MQVQITELGDQRIRVKITYFSWQCRIQSLTFYYISKL